MKEALKRELNKTYLILSSEETHYEESYEIEMIIKNEPQTILPLHVLRINGEMQLFYDVSSKQTLKTCVGRAKISMETVRTLFATIEMLIREMRDYLLNMECVVLDLEHIYTKEGSFFFCYCPWAKQDVLKSFRMMLEDILGNLDYHDTQGVELTYHLYQNACKGDFHIAEILEKHCHNEKKDKEGFQMYETDSIAESRERPEEPLYEMKKEEEKDQKQEKKGILGKILRFFMKKEQSPAGSGRETCLPQEPRNEFFEEAFEEAAREPDGLEVFEPVNTNTVLLGNMPMGCWRLRPLVPGYEEFIIAGESFLVGKKRDSVDGYIGRDTISRIHSRLYVKQGRLFIADANSTNGTFVNGVAIEPGKDVEIFQGDRILFADVEYECYNSL